MKINTQDYNDVTVVELQGELNGDFTEVFQKTISDIIAKHGKGIVLDMTKIEFVDSEGLGQLLWVRDYCDDNCCQLRLVGLDENLTKIFEVTRLDDKFDHYGELSEAVKSFA